MATAVRWSLIVPSHNGADTLPECLASLAALACPADGLEIMLVDNTSSDATVALMRDFSARTGARVLSEPRRGKSHALNTAIDRAQGEWLIFLDDDVIVDQGLVGAYAAAVSAYPEAGILAGQIRPAWRARPPAWLVTLAEQGWSCGCTPAAMLSGWMDAAHAKGGNMCIQRTLLADGRFATDHVNFGAGGCDAGGEDTELVRRLSVRTRIRHVPAAQVRHIVASREMTWSAVSGRYRRIGRSNAAQGLAGPGLGRPGARALVYGCLAAVAFAVGARAIAARYGIFTAMQIGALEQLLGKES